jgi:2-amino-4-hydroxy-6-hydroxymethyldihydropteridine diphosphokinase
MNQSLENQCFIGLGSNLYQPLQQLNNAKENISRLTDISLLKCSSIYQSKALTLDDEPQNDYFNAVIEIQTSLNANDLLDALQKLETEQGRSREKRWGARTIDMDILLYGSQQITTQRLTVPHAEIENRNFVLYPLSEISPDVIIPGKETLKALLEKTDFGSLKKIGEFNGAS